MAEITGMGGRFRRNTLNRAVSVSSNAVNLAWNINYKPFNGISSITCANGIISSIGYDNQYRVASITAGTVMNLTYTNDANGNITSITNVLDTTKSKSFAYDAIDRLVSANGVWGSLGWSYDGVGNRQTQTNGGTNIYVYQAGNNKLTSANGISYGYDNNGNTTIEGTRQYFYNQNQRLIQVNDGGISAAYAYNGSGQRVKKIVNGVSTIFHFSSAGRLIAESNGAGAVKAEYVYLNNQPIVMFEGTNSYFYVNDHLGTPQKITDSAGAVVWSAEYKPFGETISITASITNNLRFPGQYYDAETGLNYNYLRDYNPMIGRYVEADRIGIQNGENHLFVYVGNKPFDLIDPWGYLPANLLPPPGENPPNNL